MARLSVDHARCIKSGECYLAYPHLFREGKEGFPEVLIEHPEGEDDYDAAESAAYACPGRAISFAREAAESRS